MTTEPRGSRKEATPPPASLTRRTGRGALWQIMGGSGQMVIRLGASTILARCLTPSDFGLFGMAILAREFITYLGALGVGNGIIAKKDLTEDDLSTCFWAMSCVRVLMFAASYAGAPLAGIFFHEPRLVPVLRAVSATFLVSILSTVAQPLLMRNLRFAAITAVGVAAIGLESSLAVTLVLTTKMGYWALVLSMLVASLFTHLSLYVLAGWRVNMGFRHDSVQYFLKFGLAGLGHVATNYFYYNIDYIYIGKMFGSASVGIYEFAYRIPHLIQDKIAIPVSYVTYPAFAGVSDDSRLAEAYIKTVKFVWLVSLPLLLGLAAVADGVIRFVWGDQWSAAVLPMRILCGAAAARCFEQSAWGIFNAKQRPELTFHLGLVRLAVAVSAVLLMGHWFAVPGVAVGMLISTLPSGYIAFLALKMTGAPNSRLVGALAPIVVASVACAGAAFAAMRSLEAASAGAWAVLPSILIGAAVYGCVLRAISRRTILEASSVCGEVLGRKTAGRILTSALARLAE